MNTGLLVAANNFGQKSQLRNIPAEVYMSGRSASSTTDCASVELVDGLCVIISLAFRIRFDACGNQCFFR